MVARPGRSITLSRTRPNLHATASDSTRRHGRVWSIRHAAIQARLLFAHGSGVDNGLFAMRFVSHKSFRPSILPQA